MHRFSTKNHLKAKKEFKGQIAEDLAVYHEEEMKYTEVRDSPGKVLPSPPLSSEMEVGETEKSEVGAEIKIMETIHGEGTKTGDKLDAVPPQSAGPEAQLMEKMALQTSAHQLEVDELRKELEIAQKERFRYQEMWMKEKQEMRELLVENVKDFSKMNTECKKLKVDMRESNREKARLEKLVNSHSSFIEKQKATIRRLREKLEKKRLEEKFGHHRLVQTIQEQANGADNQNYLMPPIGPSGFISPTPWKQPLPPHTYKMSNWQNPQSADFYSPSCQSYQPLPPNTNTVSNWENAQSTEFRSSPCPWNQPIPFPILNFTNWKNPPSNDLPGTSTAYSSLPQQL